MFQGYSGSTVASILLSNLVSLLLGAGLGVWIYRRTLGSARGLQVLLAWVFRKSWGLQQARKYWWPEQVLPQKDFAKNVFIQGPLLVPRVSIMMSLICNRITGTKSLPPNLKAPSKPWKEWSGCGAKYQPTSNNWNVWMIWQSLRQDQMNSFRFLGTSLMRSTLHNFNITMCPGNIRKMSDIDALF